MIASTSTRGETAATSLRYEYLDALRGLAILGVVTVHSAVAVGKPFAHLDLALAGRYGVQLFFMVSAFTIFLTLDRAKESGRQSWPDFFIRRFFRVLPMFWVGLALYAFVPGRAPDYQTMSFTPQDYALSALLQHGWNPVLIDALVPGGWSIAVEGTFYLLTPLFYRGIKNWRTALLLVPGSVIASQAAYLTVAASYHEHYLFAGVPRHLMRVFVYGWFPAQLPVFACGILVYQLVRLLKKHPLSRPAGALLIILSVVWLLEIVDIDKHFWITEHVFFALGFVPLILGLETYPAGLLVNRATRFLGRVSYSTYLLHFAVMRQVMVILARLPLPLGLQGSLAAFLLLFAATLLVTVPLAWLAYRVVERPCIEAGTKLIRSRRGEFLPAPGALATR